MQPFNVEIDQAQLSRATLLLSSIGRGAATVLARAINRTLDGVKTDASTMIRAVITAKKKDVDATFDISKASAARPVGSFRSTGRPLPLISFSARQTKKGVSIQVRKDRPRQVWPHTFIAVMKTGHKGVFWRKAVGGIRVRRLPIEEKYGPRIPDIFSNEEVMDKVLASAKERIDKNMAHEIDYELLRGNG